MSTVTTNMTHSLLSGDKGPEKPEDDGRLLVLRRNLSKLAREAEGRMSRKEA